MDPEVCTEVPEILKKLARLVVRGFYTPEHTIVIDMLVRNPCMKEDDMAEMLKFERKHLRAIVNTLKLEKIIKGKLRVETDAEAKTTKHNYYFINYKMFVNVIKYKLDHMRRKIEMEERDNTSRASFKCPKCLKTFTDLEADQLYDFLTETFKCTYCQNEVEEDETAATKKDARTMLARYNEQIEPIYDMLRDCEDIKLAPELLEPEPTELKHHIRSHGSQNKSMSDRWSGDSKRGTGFGFNENTVTVTMDEDEGASKKTAKLKERPVWMAHSTVDGVPLDTKEQTSMIADAAASRPAASRALESSEVMRTLLAHEAKRSAARIPGASNNDDSSTSESDDNTPNPASAISAEEILSSAEEILSEVEEVTIVDEMESDGDEEAVVMVIIGDIKVPLNEVTDELISKMSPMEKDNYIQLSQEMYADMYE